MDVGVKYISVQILASSLVTMSKFLSLFNVQFIIFKMRANKSQLVELW